MSDARVCICGQWYRNGASFVEHENSCAAVARYKDTKPQPDYKTLAERLAKALEDLSQIFNPNAQSIYNFARNEYENAQKQLEAYKKAVSEELNRGT